MSALIEWNSVFYTEHQVIDQQHQQMIRLLNALHGCLENTGNSHDLSEQLEALCNFTMEHFATEEQVMAKMGYPHLERHKAQHELLAAKARELNQSCLNGQQPLCCDVTEQLREWMLDHFLGEDRELGLFLQQKSRSS